mgnify:CR=1 FL=1|tara:strand:- start:12 stop:338 length:327 start_codon:yes stop_codon:yes gene_type:complete
MQFNLNVNYVVDLEDVPDKLIELISRGADEFKVKIDEVNEQLSIRNPDTSAVLERIIQVRKHMSSLDHELESCIQILAAYQESITARNVAFVKHKTEELKGEVENLEQ